MYLYMYSYKTTLFGSKQIWCGIKLNNSSPEFETASLELYNFSVKRNHSLTNLSNHQVQIVLPFIRYGNYYNLNSHKFIDLCVVSIFEWSVGLLNFYFFTLLVKLYIIFWFRLVGTWCDNIAVYRKTRTCRNTAENFVFVSYTVQFL